MNTQLITPYGGKLKQLVVPASRAQTLLRNISTLPRIRLSARSLLDLELLADGSFSPLDRFMNKEEYRNVIESMRLPGGLLFPIPVTLPVSDSSGLHLDAEVCLCTPHNEPIAVMTVTDIYSWDRKTESRLVYGTMDTSHPLVNEMLSWGAHYISGPLEVLHYPRHHDFLPLRNHPAELRKKLTALAHGDVVAFQTRNPMHRV